MFEPGHLHLVSLPGLDQQDINIHIRYEVRQNAESGAYVHFDMDGEIDGKPFSDSFELPRDTAFNFASDATRVAQKHGLHPKFGAITRAQGIRCDVRGHSRQAACPSRRTGGSRADHSPRVSRVPGGRKHGKGPISTISGLFVCRRSRSRGTRLAGKRKRLAACRFRVTLK